MITGSNHSSFNSNFQSNKNSSRPIFRTSNSNTTSPAVPTSITSSSPSSSAAKNSINIKGINHVYSTSKSFSNNYQTPLGHLYYLEDVTVSFGPLQALKSIHLTINSGEKIFLIGPSGAGKSTLLKLLAGIIRPQTGKIQGPANPNYASKFDSIAEAPFVSMIFQDLQLINPWSVEENLQLAYDNLVYNNQSEFQSEMYNLCKLFGIRDRLALKVQAISGGMRQKVAIIRSLLTRPQVLLADEPSASLDRESSMKLYEILTHYNEKKGLTIVWASHSQELIKQYSGKVIHLNEGQLIYTGYACFIG